MMRLDEEMISKLDLLSRAFLRRARVALSGVPFREEVTDGLRITVPCRSEMVGDLKIHLDGDEITMYLGRHTHCHFSLYMVAKDPDPEERISAEAVRFLTDVLNDQVVIWSKTVDGKPGSGGSYRLDAEPRLKPSGADCFLWSGKRV
jgi:hypothetical protein